MLALFLLSSGARADSCQEWFARQKIKRDKDCLLNCSLAPTNMGSFDCGNQCDDLCETPYHKTALFNLSSLYPGLTPAEKALVNSDPKKMYKAYKMSWKAEELCNKIYRSTRRNDESDACRHFVWSALMTNELGKEFTSKVLSAHEQAKDQPSEEKAMDLENNRRGLKASENLIKNKNFSEEKIMKEFKEQLGDGKLIVLKKRNLQ